MGKILLSLGAEIVENADVLNAVEKAEEGEPASWLVCLLGIAVVFGGLFLLIGLVDLMNAFFRKTPTSPATETNVAPAATALPQTANTTIENKQEIIAAVCAAVAEENGTDISAIRVISFKKL